MNTPTLEQIAYRWQNNDSLPGKDSAEPKPMTIAQEIRDKVSAQFESGRRTYLDDTYKKLAGDD